MVVSIMALPFLNEWHLYIAIKDADTDTREAPWYGPWDIALWNYIFALFCGPPYLTITYPQFPMSKYIDIWKTTTSKMMRTVMTMEVMSK